MCCPWLRARTPFALRQQLVKFGSRGLFESCVIRRITLSRKKGRLKILRAKSKEGSRTV